MPRISDKDDNKIEHNETDSMMITTMTLKNGKNPHAA